MNPDDFVITRKRKKYKFAKFFNAPNCFEFEQWTKQPVDVVEIGAGTGLFSVELATLHPEKIYLALDVKADRLQKGAYVALERGLKNIIFLRARADQLADIVTPGSLSEVYVTFPDPYLRKRSAGRRLTHPTFLHKYAALLKQDGLLKLKHDNLDFFTWSLEQLILEKWRITELSFDLHQSELRTDAKILTTYERRWLGEGRKINYLTACVS